MKRRRLVSTIFIFTIFFTGCNTELVEIESNPSPSPYETFSITKVEPTPTIEDYQNTGENKGEIVFIITDIDDYSYHIYIIAAGGGIPIRLTSNPDDVNEGPPTWSPDGSMIAFHSGEVGLRNIFVYDVHQDELTLVTQHQDSLGPEWSPDSKKIAFVSDRDGNRQLFVIGVDGTNEIKLLEDMNQINDLAWSPDGNWIAFSAYVDGKDDIFIVKEDGSYLERLTEDPEYDGEPVWSPDGSQIAFVSGRTGNAEIFLLDIESRIQTQLTNGLEPDFFPVWSPDGSKIAFESGYYFKRDIYVIDADGTNRIQLSNNPCDDAGPTWSPDGTQVAFSAFIDKNRDMFIPECRVGNHEILIADVDGSNLIHLMDNEVEAEFPDWQP